MTRLPTISVCHHRGKPHFRWYQNGRPRYRVIRDVQNIEMERIQLSAQLLNGTSRKTTEQPHKTLEDHVEDFYQDLLATASPKQAAQTRKRVEATVHEAGIKTLSDITVAKVRAAINRLRCAVRNPKKELEGYSGQDRAWLYLLASMTGLRRGELAALEPASFDFTARSVAVAAAVRLRLGVHHGRLLAGRRVIFQPAPQLGRGLHRRQPNPLPLIC